MIEHDTPSSAQPPMVAARVQAVPPKMAPGVTPRPPETGTPSTARTEAGAYKPEAWRMRDYYPDSFAKFMSALGIGIDYDDGDYERYEAEFAADLAAHDAELRTAVLAQVREGLNGLPRWVDFSGLIDRSEALDVVDRLEGKQ